MKKNGVIVELKTYKGAGHGFFNREPYLVGPQKNWKHFSEA